MPRSSMSRMVKAPMPEAFTVARSATSTSRMPTSAAREPSTIGAKPARFTSSAAPRPSTTASGMPWMLPLGLVSGVFASACASNQTRPSFCCAVGGGARARRSCPSRRSGRRPARRAAIPRRAPRPRGRAAAADLEDLLQVLEARVAGALRLLDLDVQVAPVVDLVAERRDLRVRLRPRGKPRGPCRRRGGRRRGRGERR